MIKVKSFKKLRGSSKKYEITFEKNGKMYIRKFGAAGMSDYTIHKDKERRERYISRHKKDLRTNDPMKPGYLSMYILWNKPSLKASLTDYKRRLNIYNKTGKFPKSITGSKKLSFGTVENMKNHSDIERFFREKVGRDPSINFIEPQLIKNLKDYSASRISSAYRGKTVRANLPTKKKLKDILWNLNAEYVSPVFADEEMKSGSPWTVLDPGKKETAKWLYLAAETLTPKDFDEDELWYNSLEHILSEFKKMDPDRFDYDPEVQRYLTVSTDNIEVLMQRLGFFIDFEPLGDYDAPWYEKAMEWLTEEWATGNAFGKKYKVPDNVVNKRLYSNAKAKIKRSIKGRRWGAYDSGRLVREYKAAGGKYKGSKGKTNLSRWYKEKWVDACAWPKRKPCGRNTKETIAYCRPSKKVDSKTPKLVQKLTAAQRKSRCARKKKTLMKRITKFGQTTPDIEIGNGWVIHCNFVPGIGPHATLRRKDISGPTQDTDHAFRYGIKYAGNPPEFWSSGLLAKKGLSPEYQTLLMNHYHKECGGFNPRQLPPRSPRAGPSLYLTSFGAKKKLKQDMYNDIFLGSDDNLGRRIGETLAKRCPDAISPRLKDKICEKRVTSLMLSIYYTMVKNKIINLNTPRKEEINRYITKMYKYSDAPTVLNLRNKHLINEFLTGLQGGYYGMIFQPQLANGILESITT